MENIPTFQDKGSSFEQEILIGDRIVKITLFWNSRSEAWYMSVEDVDTEDKLLGIKVVPYWPAIRQFRAYLPNLEGDIMLIPSDVGIEERVTYDNLDNGYSLNYLTEEELETWEDENKLG